MIIFSCSFYCVQQNPSSDTFFADVVGRQHQSCFYFSIDELVFLINFLQATKRHLSQKLEILDGKVEEQKEMSKLIMNEVGFMIPDLELVI